ncbi:hypothetical protein F2Q69_00059350 [Brassica cretica]|uniref:Uncharacterized protein n=1 Tax=Brassica cretica TaxID=69181 RepID=A0A8S9RCE1_BRACR|nr:hypothetical protein F2Q69_00059350 [Brassica cretica]
MVFVASNIVISSRFSVTTAPVLSSTYPPPLLAVKKISPPPLPPFPRPSPTAGALHCCRSPSITTIALQDRHLPLASDLQRCLPVSSTCLGSIPFRDSQASNLRIYVLHFRCVNRCCVRALMYLVSPPGRFESPTPATAPFQPSIASAQVFMPPAIHLTSRQLHPTNGAKLHRSNRCLLVTAGPIVQEYCFARVAHDYVTAASLSHYAVSSIDGSSQSRIGGLPDLLLAELLCKSVDSPDFITPSPLRLHHITPSPASTVLHKCDDCTLRSPSVTNCWAQHGNVEFRGLDPIKPSVLSSNFILSASLEVKLEFEIHLVSSVSLVGFKADCACFSAKSSQIGLRTLNVVNDSGASHLKFLLVNIPIASYRCINVVFDYQLLFRTIVMGHCVCNLKPSGQFLECTIFL